MKKIIQPGDTAPVIRTTDVWGRAVSVPTVDKWVYVSFHRFAACPFCNLRTNELIREYDRFQNHAMEIVSIWPSEKENLLQHAGSEQLPFSMVSDADREFYRLYGVTQSSLAGGLKLLLHPRLVVKALRNKRKKIEVDTDPMLMPASFVIAPDGRVHLAHYGRHFGDHPSVESILEQVNAQRS